MTGREWKPGDVASAKHPFEDGEIRGFIDTDGRFYTTDKSVNGISSSVFALANLRPLLVIDPEDGEQIKRLVVLLSEHGWQPTEPHGLRDALRALAQPKPAEPTGLGAVVEDANGMRWTRPNDAGEWFSADGDAVETSYAAVDAVRVLSEGVTA